VALVARREALLLDVAQRATTNSNQLRIYAADVTDTRALQSALGDANTAFQGLDTVVANAGMGIPTRLNALRMDQIREVLELNLFATLDLCINAIPILKRSPKGTLVAISSMAAWRSGPGAAPYNASKAALSSFLEGVRPEIELKGVRLLEVTPGFVKSPMTDRNKFPMPFMVQSDRAAQVIIRALEKGKRHCSFPLAMTLFLGGVRRLPDSWFDALNRRLLRKLNESDEPQSGACDS
jgi:short-subunit dehydrogenase